MVSQLLRTRKYEIHPLPLIVQMGDVGPKCVGLYRIAYALGKIVLPVLKDPRTLMRRDLDETRDP